jgi:hypothetical protein
MVMRGVMMVRGHPMYRVAMGGVVVAGERRGRESEQGGGEDEELHRRLLEVGLAISVTSYPT